MQGTHFEYAGTNHQRSVSPDLQDGYNYTEKVLSQFRARPQEQVIRDPMVANAYER